MFDKFWLSPYYMPGPVSLDEQDENLCHQEALRLMCVSPHRLLEGGPTSPAFSRGAGPKYVLDLAAEKAITRIRE